MSVSIGIPFYNCERFLPYAIRSVFAQTCQDWELLLVDDGSTDQSLEIARSVRDSRVRVISDGHNLRLPNRLNQIVAESQFDLIARMDADDIMHPKRLEMQCQAFGDPATQIVSTAYYTINDDNNIKTVRCTKATQDVSLSGVLNYKHCLCHPSIMVRKSWFERNPYDAAFKFGQDLELFARTSANGELNNTNARLITKPLLFYREDSLQQNAQKVQGGQQLINEVLKMYVGQLSFLDRLCVKTKWCLRNNTYRWMSVFGILPWFKQLRECCANTLSDYREIIETLQQVLETPVPGMDEHLAHPPAEK